MKAKPAKHPGEVVLELNRRDETLMATACSERKASVFSLKQILVPLDFSECSKKALRYAVALAREHDATITALYVIPPIYGVGEYGGVDYSALEEQARAYSEKELSALIRTEVEGKISADMLVRSGPPAARITEAARDIPADIIVIATHGRTGLKQALMGSVAEQVVRTAPCPVLVVREHEHEFLVE